jgi:tol-pal system protein YbgF
MMRFLAVVLLAGCFTSKYEGELLRKDVNNLQQRLDALDRRDADINEQVARLKRVLEETLGTKGSTGPVDKDSLFAQAQQKLAAGEHDEARRLLRQFISQYPQDARAAQAQLLHGESYYQQKKYAAAIGELQKVIDNYARSPAVEEAMFKIGMSFLELRYCTDARTFLAEALKRYPRSPHAGQIQRSLAEIQRNAKNRKVCSN